MALPVIRGASTPLYPFVRTVRTGTRLHAFENSSEQRFAIHAPLVDFTLPLGFLAGGQLQSLRGAHASAKGALTTNLSLVLGATTYTNLAFLDDDFHGEEYAPLMYKGEYRLKQTVPQTLPSNANGNVFPAVLAQLPFTRSTSSRTYLKDQESGIRYSYGQYGTGLTGFPTGQRFTWTLPYDMLADDELASLEQFFIAMNGRLRSFSFTDPEDGSTYSDTRFDMDDLEIHYQQIGQTSLILKITTPFFNA